MGWRWTWTIGAVLLLTGCAPIHGHTHMCQHDHEQGFMEHVHTEPLKACYDLHRFTKPIDPDTAGKDESVEIRR